MLLDVRHVSRVGLLLLVELVAGCFGLDGQKYCDSGTRGCQRVVDASGWYCIKGAKTLSDASTEGEKECYKLQIDFDRDLNELVRMANDTKNIGRKIKCRIWLKHSGLSDELNVTHVVPCTMTERHIGAIRRPVDDRQGGFVDYPARVSETWGVGDLRWFRAPQRFDLVFTLSIDCYGSKSDADKATAIDLRDSARCEGLSVFDNVVCNIQTQCDYYVCVDVRIITYKGSDGRPSMAGLCNSWN